MYGRVNELASFFVRVGVMMVFPQYNLKTSDVYFMIVFVFLLSSNLQQDKDCNDLSFK